MGKSMLQYDEPDRLHSIEDLLPGYDEKDPMAFARGLPHL
jgi:hypothetical protein